MSELVKHLARDRCYDEWSTWCGDYGVHSAEEPADATCGKCLRAALVYGSQASRRLAQLGDMGQPD